MDLRYELVVVREHPDQLTLAEIASLAGTHIETVRLYVELGVVQPVSQIGAQLLFDANALCRLKAIGRLRRDLGANVSSLGMILDLVDRIKALQHEVEILRARL
jgi:DNA-binding transcriptional MerR regulator